MNTEPQQASGDNAQDNDRSPVPHLLNRQNVKRLALEVADAFRARKFTRVSKEFVARAETHMRGWIIAEVKRLPSVGKTIR